MLDISLRRLLLMLSFPASIYVIAQFTTVYFYVWEFQDCVKDELKFGPNRGNVRDEDLMNRISELAQYFNIDLDVKEAKIEKTVTIPGMKWSTLQVDLRYSVPVDLRLYTHQLQFHTTESVIR